MSIELIKRLQTGAGAPVVPALESYDDASDGWSETEYHAEAFGSVLCGTWEGAPGWVRIDHWPYNEICLIRSGSVEIEDSRGASAVFSAGDAFVVPAGFRGVWRTLEPCEKVFVAVPQ